MIFRHEFEAAQAGQASINDMYKAVNASPLSAMAVGGRGGGGGAHGHNPTSAGSKEPVEKFQKRLNRVKLRVRIHIFSTFNLSLSRKKQKPDRL